MKECEYLRLRREKKRNEEYFLKRMSRLDTSPFFHFKPVEMKKEV
jgi:hypothetical protein